MYNALMQQCSRVLVGRNLAKEVWINLLSKDNHFAQSTCLKTINNANTAYIVDPITNDRYPVASQDIQDVLNVCKQTHNILFLHISYNLNGQSMFIPVKLEVENGRVRISNVTYIRQVLVNFVTRLTTERDDISADVINMVIAGLTKIMDSGYLRRSDQADFREMLMEIVAIKNGFKLEGNPDISSPKDKSKSWSPRDGLAPLPKGSVNALLKELEAACIDMQDMITLEEFRDWEKDKKKLQLIVKVGPKNAAGQQRCYYVKNIYEYVKSMVEQGLQPKEPVSKVRITPEEIRDEIMPKMRYLDPTIAEPGVVERKQYPKLTLELREYVSDVNQRNFYEVVLRRNVGTMTSLRYSIGVIPADVETGDADIQSTVVAAKIRELFDSGRLLDNRMQMRVHLNKNEAYWNTDVNRKLRSMLDELTSI